MKIYNRAALLIFFSFGFFTLTSFKTPHASPVNAIDPLFNQHPKIQVAILLDVSNSMDGLIEQAKAQLWNMVTIMGKTRCGDATPQIEIALYEYGRSNNDVKEGYVKQLSGFTSDLDKLSQTLFNIKTYGGDEYCGQVMYTSLTHLNWDSSAKNYKVIFIAGNEDFLQGNVTYTKACMQAKKKGVIINSIYCGDRLQGIQEHWNITGECGGGSYTNINQDAKMDHIATPYDDQLFVMNEQLNNTYIAYGAMGRSNARQQAEMDEKNYSMNKSAGINRISVKGKKNLYKNNHWDLVDAEETNSDIINKVDMKTLPDSLQNKTREELKQIVRSKNAQRSAIQQQIATTSIKREEYIKAEKAKLSGNKTIATLETEIAKIIKQQAKRFNMIVTE